MARSQFHPSHVFFEDILEAYRDKYSAEEKENIIKYLLDKYSPIDNHHPSDILECFNDSYVLSDFLQRPEYAYLSEYLKVWNEGKTLIYNDDKDQFASFLETNHILIEKLPPAALLHSICTYSAVGCATVLFDSGLIVNGNVDMNTDTVTEEQSSNKPIIYRRDSLYAAVFAPSPSIEIIKLLLNHGATPDAWAPSTLGFLLQNLMKKHCYILKDWTSETSIYKLFYLLCLPELDETLEIIKLLASHMKLVDPVLADLIEAGQFVELAALVMAARDQLLVSSVKDGGLVNTSAGKYIVTESRKRSEEELSLTDAEVLDSSKSDKKSNFLFALHLVNTLWKSIDVLHNYRVSERAKSVSKDQVPFDIAADLLSKTELVLHKSDVYCEDIHCLRPKNPNALEALCPSQHFRGYARKLEPGSSLVFKRSYCSPHTCHAYNIIKKAMENQTMKTIMQGRSLLPNSISSMSEKRLEPGSSLVLKCSYRSLHTCHAYNCMIKKPMGNQTMKTIMQGRLLLPNSFSSTTEKKCSPVLRFSSLISSSFNKKHAKFELSKTKQMTSPMRNISASICSSLTSIAKRSIM